MILAKLCEEIFLVVWYLATLAQVYYKLDNGSNVCGLEFNFTRRNTFVKCAQNSVRNDIRDDVSYDKQIFQQFSHGFEVESEEGRSVFTIWNLTLTFLSVICHLCDSMTMILYCHVYSAQLGGPRVHG